jgi:hypothetical protein
MHERLNGPSHPWTKDSAALQRAPRISDIRLQDVVSFFLRQGVPEPSRACVVTPLERGSLKRVASNSRATARQPMSRMGGNAGETIGQPGLRIDAIHLGRLCRPPYYAERVRTLVS